jgi:hypothetical protein
MLLVFISCCLLLLVLVEAYVKHLKENSSSTEKATTG